MYPHIFIDTYPVLPFIALYSHKFRAQNTLFANNILFSRLHFYIFLTGIVTNTGILWVYILVYFYIYGGHFW